MTGKVNKKYGAKPATQKSGRSKRLGESASERKKLTSISAKISKLSEKKTDDRDRTEIEERLSSSDFERELLKEDEMDHVLSVEAKRELDELLERAETIECTPNFDLSAKKDRRDEQFEELRQEGIENGYPEKLHKPTVKKRAKKLAEDMRELLFAKLRGGEGESESESDGRRRPRQCKIFDDILEFIQDRPWVSTELLIDYDRLPMYGYYGQHIGNEVLASVLQAEIGEDVRRAFQKYSSVEWLSKFPNVDTVIRATLAPEASVHLIMQDQQVGYEEAFQIWTDSDEYGRLVMDRNFRSGYRVAAGRSSPPKKKRRSKSNHN